MRDRVSGKQCAGLLAALFTVAYPTQACLHDRDTDRLTAELAKYGKPTFALSGNGSPAATAGLTNIASVLTGRFSRNPALYYEMRIARLRKELADAPSQIALYDDIAVAYDRLGKYDTALQWMERKRQQLAGTSSEDLYYKGAWYRYYANIGTFRLHHWLTQGANPKSISIVQQAREEIARAITIQPETPLGQENYQLLMLDWILAGFTVSPGEVPKASLLTHYICFNENSTVPNRIAGLVGLVALDDAGENVDVFYALTDAFLQARDYNMAEFAVLRAQELIDAGKKPLHPAVTERMKGELQSRAHYSALMDRSSIRTTKIQFTEQRQYAEAIRKAGTQYMLVRLRQGRHPDTDPLFWQDWHPAPAPSLELLPKTFENNRAAQSKKRTNPTVELASYSLLSLFGGLGILGVAAFARRKRRNLPGYHPFSQ